MYKEAWFQRICIGFYKSVLVFTCKCSQCTFNVVCGNPDSMLFENGLGMDKVLMNHGQHSN